MNREKLHSLLASDRNVLLRAHATVGNAKAAWRAREYCDQVSERRLRGNAGGWVGKMAGRKRRGHDGGGGWGVEARVSRATTTTTIRQD